MAFDKKKYLFYRGMLENNTERLSLEQLFFTEGLESGIGMVCCRKISLGTICRTVRDEADDPGDSQRKKFLREINKVVRGSEHNILYMSFI